MYCGTPPYGHPLNKDTRIWRNVYKKRCDMWSTCNEHGTEKIWVPDRNWTYDLTYQVHYDYRRFNTILLLKNRGKIAWYVWSPSFLRRLTLVLKSLNKVLVPPAAQFWFLLLYAAVFCPTFLFLWLFLCFCLNVNNLCVRDVFLRTHSNTDTGLTNTDTIAVADSDLQIRGVGEAVIQTLR